MNKTTMTALAALLALGSTICTAGAQESSDNGNHYGQRQRNAAYASQCYGNGQRRGHHDGDNDRDDRNGNGNGRYNNNGQNTNGSQYGYGQYGQSGYGQNGQYGYGQYGNNAPYNANGNCANSGRAGSTVRGSIVGVNGNQVTLQTQNYRTVTINDQPALDRQATGRVAIGRIVTAYGYWQSGEFYATQLI
jgi:hypothetical protein